MIRIRRYSPLFRIFIRLRQALSLLPARPAGNIALFLLFLLIWHPLGGCGKKGAPTLGSFEKSDPPVLLTPLQREKVILVSWSFPRSRESEISGFTLLRSEGGEFEKIADTGNTLRSFSDTGFRNGTSYRYKIVSVNRRGVAGDDSNIVSLTAEEVPLPPQDVTLNAKDEILILSWKDMGKGVFYNVYRSTEKGKYDLHPVNASPLTQHSFEDTLSLDGPAYYTIRALRNVTSRGEGPPSEEVSFDPLSLVPPAPAGMRISSAPDGISLSWDAPAAPWVTGYRIYRRMQGGEFALLGETQVPAFTDSEKSPGMRDYRIHAVGPVREGAGTEISGVTFLSE